MTNKRYTGKTSAILKRLPHFFNPDEIGDFMLNLVDVFGKNLEQTESDLYKVLQSHHVRTADNAGSQGYFASHESQGDLDKIYSLYLDAVGGTSQIVSMNPYFTIRSIDAKKMFQNLFCGKESNLNNLIIEAFKYTSDYDKNITVINRYKPEFAHFSPDKDISVKFVTDLILRKKLFDDNETFTEYLFNKLPNDILQLLTEFSGTLSKELKEKLTDFLNKTVLYDRSFFTLNYKFFKNFNLEGETQELLNRVYKEFLKKKYREEYAEEPGILEEKLEALDEYQSDKVISNIELVKVNRLLLNHVSGSDGVKWGFEKKSFPDIEKINLILTEMFNQVIDPQNYYTGTMSETLRKLFVKDNFPGLEYDYDDLKKIYKGNIVWFFRILLEEAFPLEIEKIYRSYQKRLRAIIEVLKNGASTKKGIIDIVAANLGIFDNDSQSIKARKLIRIEEYDPKETHFAKKKINIYDKFIVKNNNPEQETPGIRITMLKSDIEKISDITISDGNKDFSINVEMKSGDQLICERDYITLNGVEVKKSYKGSFLSLNGYEEKEWSFEAKVLCKDDNTFKDLARYSRGHSFDKKLFAGDENVVNIEVLSYKLTPGRFKVIIPWNIEGYTNKFTDSKDHPRHQILPMINTVKAFGVKAEVAYEQNFKETHEHKDKIGIAVKGDLLNTEHEISDTLSVESRQKSKEVHEIKDNLKITGVYDYTRFDSANKFE